MQYAYVRNVSITAAAEQLNHALIQAFKENRYVHVLPTFIEMEITFVSSCWNLDDDTQFRIELHGKK